MTMIKLNEDCDNRITVRKRCPPQSVTETETPAVDTHGLPVCIQRKAAMAVGGAAGGNGMRPAHACIRTLSACNWIQTTLVVHRRQEGVICIASRL